MSRYLLVLLIMLLLIVCIGIATHSYRESFSNHVEIPIVAAAAVSPVMANLTAALQQPSQKRKELPQIDVIGRESDVINNQADNQENNKQKPGCPVCKEQCPDMSKYIRRDSIPCWNCSL